MNNETQAQVNLIKAAREAREYGFAVVIFTPEELEIAGVAPHQAEDEMISGFNENYADYEPEDQEQ